MTVCVKWGSVVSSNFTVLNGVRQGGILSQWFLIYIYIDDLRSILSSCNSGCKFGNQTINHISYADDLLIFCPSSKGLQGLLTSVKFTELNMISNTIRKKLFDMYDYLAPWI